MVTSTPFTLVSAFSTTQFDGNPAVVVFMDPDVELSTLRGLSNNFNQPMAAFIRPPSLPTHGQKTVPTDIRYVTSTGLEAPVCGHATVAATKAILDLPGFSGAGIKEIQFQTRTKGIISVKILEGGLLELRLPSTTPQLLSDEEVERVSSIVHRAFKRTVNIINVRHGGENYPHILMVEIHEDEILKGSDIDVSVFGETGYGINSISSNSTPNSIGHSGEEYICRMFSPHLPGGEDPVCGSMQCILAPYWYTKKGIQSGTSITSKQLIWNGTDVYDLWSWSTGATHQTAHTIQRLRRNLYTVLVGPLGKEPNCRMLLKIARTERELNNLKHEAEFYTNDIKDLQGSVVPRFYGLYRTKIEGEEFACSILEYCESIPLFEPREFHRRVMVAICKLHAAGVYHNNLLQSFHHIIYAQGQEVRFIDFSAATRHQCMNAVPTLYTSHPEGDFCKELVDMERFFGLQSDPPSVVNAVVAAQAYWSLP